MLGAPAPDAAGAVLGGSNVTVAPSLGTPASASRLAPAPTFADVGAGAGTDDDGGNGLLGTSQPRSTSLGHALGAAGHTSESRRAIPSRATALWRGCARGVRDCASHDRLSKRSAALQFLHFVVMFGLIDNLGAPAGIRSIVEEERAAEGGPGASGEEVSGAAALRMGYAVTVRQLCELAFNSAWGALSDKVGRRPALAACLSGSLLGALVLALAVHQRSMAGVYLAFCVMGCTDGFALVLYAGLADLRGRGSRSRSGSGGVNLGARGTSSGSGRSGSNAAAHRFALVGFAMGSGGLVGPLVYDLLTTSLGFSVPAAIAAASVFLATALAIIKFGMEESLRLRRGPASAASAVSASEVCRAITPCAANPYTAVKRLASDRRLVVASAVSVLTHGVNQGFFTVYFFTARDLRLSPHLTSLLLSAVSVVSAAAQLSSPRIAPHKDWTLTGTLGVYALSLGVLALAEGPTGMAAGVLLFAVGLGGSFPLMLSKAAECMPRDAAGEAMGGLRILNLVAMVVGAQASATLFDASPRAPYAMLLAATCVSIGAAVLLRRLEAEHRRLHAISAVGSAGVHVELTADHDRDDHQHQIDSDDDRPQQADVGDRGPRGGAPLNS